VETYPYGVDWSQHRTEHVHRVGIIMRTRDRPTLLARALESVAEQSFHDWHLVVVNHGGEQTSVDAAVDAIATTAKGKLEVVHLDAAGGMERASNAGLARLDTEFVAVHDDDDTWLPTFLVRTVAFLGDPAHCRYGGVVTHGVKRWERMSGAQITQVLDEPLDGVDAFVDAQRLFGWNRFLPINFLVRSAVFDVVGPFNEDLPVIGDWDFHLRVAAVTDIGFIPEPLARYHLRREGDHPNTITAAEGRHLDMDARLRAAVLRRYLDVDPSRLGLLVALSHDDEMARRLSERIRDVVELVDWRTHHTGNRINDIHERIIRMDDRLAAVDERLARIHAQLDEVRADTTRIHKAVSVVGAPLRPLRRAREKWRLRSR
jgi:glycosyltransferase involved in cell wall biosynthesis